MNTMVEDMSRRGFLKKSAVGLVGLAAGTGAITLSTRLSHAGGHNPTYGHPSIQTVDYRAPESDVLSTLTSGYSLSTVVGPEGDGNYIIATTGNGSIALPADAVSIDVADLYTRLDAEGEILPDDAGFIARAFHGSRYDAFGVGVADAFGIISKPAILYRRSTTSDILDAERRNTHYGLAVKDQNGIPELYFKQVFASSTGGGSSISSVNGGSGKVSTLPKQSAGSGGKAG
jgi:hypothetical protein